VRTSGQRLRTDWRTRTSHGTERIPYRTRWRLSCPAGALRRLAYLGQERRTKDRHAAPPGDGGGGRADAGVRVLPLPGDGRPVRRLFARGRGACRPVRLRDFHGRGDPGRRTAERTDGRVPLRRQGELDGPAGQQPRALRLYGGVLREGAAGRRGAAAAAGADADDLRPP